MPQPSAIISPENAHQLTELARWGRGVINDVAVSGDGRWVAVAATTGVYIHNAQNLQAEPSYLQTPASVTVIDISSDGSKVALGLDAGITQVWDMGNGTLLFSKPQQTWQLQFAPNSETLAVVSENGVEVWLVSNGEVLQVFEDAFGIEFSHDEDKLAVWDYKTLSLFSWPNSVLLREIGPILYTVAEQGEQKASDSIIADVGFSETDEPILMNLPSYPNGTTGRVEFQQGIDGQLLLTVPPIALLSERIEGACNVPIYFADPPTPPQAWQFEFSPETQITALKYNDVGFGGNVKENTSIQFYRLDTGQQLYTLEEGVVDIAFLPDGETWVAGFQDGRLQIRSIRDGSVLDEVDAYESPILDLVVSPDNQMLAVQYLDEVKVANVADGVVTQRYPAVRVAISPDSTTFALGYADGRIEFRATGDGSLLKNLNSHTDVITALTFSLSGERLISAGLDCQLNVWQVPEGILSGQLENYMIDGLLPNESEFTPMRVWDWYLPSTEPIIVGRFFNSVGVWNLSDGVLQHVSEPINFVNDLAGSPVGSDFAIAGSPLRLWQINPSEDFSNRWEGHRTTTTAFSPDGQLLISGLGDKFNGSLDVWLVNDGELFHTLGDQKITALAFAPNGYFLVSASLDGLVQLWGIP
ncbi:MAG: WD40 repeat domain-containing protein [Anaerolineae bacterium]|nr:WD40 repeat domain-containing protein [Anaerolineae bacterium]